MKQQTIAVVLVLALLSMASLGAATEYKVRVLDPLPGYTYSAAYSINANGKIVGYSAPDYFHQQTAHLVLWDESGVHDLGIIRDATYTATAINDRDEVVGAAYVWRDGESSTLPTLDPPWGRNVLFDINDLGDVVGFTYSAQPRRAVLWDSSGIHNLGVLPGQDWSMARGINNHRQVVGTSEGGNVGTSAFFWENNVMTRLDFLPDYMGSVAVRINDAGDAVGISYTWAMTGGIRIDRACLWRNKTLIDIGGFSEKSTNATDINNRGQIVGYSYLWGQVNSSRPFLWENGNVTMIEGLGSDAMAYGINDNGWIVGAASTAYSKWQAVVWEPVPEPYSLAALVLGLVPLVSSAMQRKRG